MGKRSTVLFILFLLFAAGITGDIHAASHKKKKKKKHKTDQSIQADSTAADTSVHHYTRKEQRKMHRQERKRLKKERKMHRKGRGTEASPAHTEPVVGAEFKYPATTM